MSQYSNDSGKAGERGMLTEDLFPEELLLEMRIDLAIRDVLIKHREKAWKVMEYDLLPALDVHKWYASKNGDIGKQQAAKEWLEIMHNKTNLSDSEMYAEMELRSILWEHKEKAWNVMEKRVKDLKDHRHYLYEWRKNDAGREGAVDDWIKKYTWYQSRELLRIEYCYKQGKYDAVEKLMYEFVKEHSEDIKDVVENRSDIEYTKTYLKKKKEQMKEKGETKLRRKTPVSLIYATHLLLLGRKSVSTRTENAMQIEEVCKEAFIKHNPDLNQVMIDWSKEHAVAWRDHYTSVLEFILRTQEEKFLSVLKEQVPSCSAGSYANAG
jgi:hypothetical protein